MRSRVSRPTVILEGPIFTKQARLSWLANVRALMDEVARIGQEDVVAQIAAIPPHGIRTGRTRARIRGRTESLRKKRWQYNLVISPDISGLDADQAKALLAAASEIESRRKVFRRTKARLLRAIRAQRDMTRGMT